MRASGNKPRRDSPHGRVVGIDMGASNVRFALADFDGEPIAVSAGKLRPEDGPEKMIGGIKEGVRAILDRDGAPGDAHRGRIAKSRVASRDSHGVLRAIAIGVPSPVDPESGAVAFANNLPGWRNIHLGREIMRAFRVPVLVENDANLAAIGEHWRGVARGVRNFVFIALGTGIGSGIFANGQLYRGRTGNAGELYRLNVEWPRWNDDFGEVGYFESHVAGLGIAAEGRRAFGADGPSPATGLVEERNAEFVFERFREGDPTARAVLERVFTVLGVGVADLVSVLDPDLIVFGGGVVKGAPDFLLETVGRVVRRIHPDIAPPIKLSSLEDKAQTYGAIYSALEAARQLI